MVYVDGRTMLSLEIGFGPRGTFIFGACDLYFKEVLVGGVGIPVALAFEKMSLCLELELDGDRGRCGRGNGALSEICCG